MENEILHVTHSVVRRLNLFTSQSTTQQLYLLERFPAWFIWDVYEKGASQSLRLVNIWLRPEFTTVYCLLEWIRVAVVKPFIEKFNKTLQFPSSHRYGSKTDAPRWESVNTRRKDLEDQHTTPTLRHVPASRFRQKRFVREKSKCDVQKLRDGFLTLNIFRLTERDEGRRSRKQSRDRRGSWGRRELP